MFYLRSGNTQRMVIVNVISRLQLEATESVGEWHLRHTCQNYFCSLRDLPPITPVNVSVSHIADTDCKLHRYCWPIFVRLG